MFTTLADKIQISKSGYLKDWGVKLGIIILISILITLGLTSLKVGATDNNSTIQIRTGHLQNKEDNIELSKGVKIKKGDIDLSAPRGTMKRQEKKLTLLEGVKMNYDQGDIESQKMVGWLNDNKYLFEKEVVFDYQPLDKDKRGFVLKAPYLEMLSDDKSFVAKNGVTINYNKKLLKADKAEYSDENEQLILNDNVHIKEENGDWIKSQKAVFDLSTGQEDFKADGDVEIELKLDEEKNGNSSSE